MRTYLNKEAIMAEAWQKREFEQQELLNQIMQDARCAVREEDEDDVFFLTLTAELAGLLAIQRITGRGGAVPDGLTFTTNDQLAQSCVGRIKRTIDEFSRTPEEAAQLLGRLLVKFANSGLSDIGTAYLRQQVHEPQRLYDGHESMDEVPFLAEASE